ncbi:MAG: HAMP domain-containing histidine kinase [Dorea sp.]|nr:HAMP domain-containing histidine kinase [Dorea sp.]
MTFSAYIKNKLLPIILHIFCMLVLFFFLHATGYPDNYSVLVLSCWMLITAAFFSADYCGRRKYFSEISKLLKETDKRYLLGELMPKSLKLEDRLYKEMIRLAGKSVIERIRKAEQEKKEYREFIESWVHEIKAPITGVSLICENNKSELTKRIWLENRKTENYVDMALYYARAGEVYKDYMIRETDLSETVSSVLSGNKYELIQSGVQVTVDCGHAVYTDGKWIAFILNQLVLNSVKYKNGDKEQLCIRTEEQERSVRLVVEDDGIGIKKEELPRIFEKGFTGSNGRMTQRATGMGLYLCKSLCKKLGIGITALSKEGEGTRIILEFPVGDYYARE